MAKFAEKSLKILFNNRLGKQIRRFAHQMSAEKAMLIPLEKDRIISLSEFKDKVLLVVNVASHCGYTPNNYEQLGKLAEKYDSQGLKVLLFPCNQSKLESGTTCQIRDFSSGFSTKLVMFHPIKVNGSEAHPLFSYLKKACPGTLGNAIKWNFTKFLVNRYGIPVKRFGPNEEPMTFEEKIVALLNEKADAA
ncbi:glutathione peroxidase [Mitosporidium daphniae]|uniref:Glutathione peroxidase n=1 Tax=Mitosporidium daphniae TaxID=1485682 RepID=A0A098VP49_9MICR|nr:glutathione peroxidase [Mitosporidium daphniae]KGG50579.1 glutathione peroxidase [Mitosporidium daphniae]|eukprot:XP_013237026.1 glutathione peroxidase [Mitosporidium daphniae]